MQGLVTDTGDGFIEGDVTEAILVQGSDGVRVVALRGKCVALHSTDYPREQLATIAKLA